MVVAHTVKTWFFVKSRRLAAVTIGTMCAGVAAFAVAIYTTTNARRYTNVFNGTLFQNIPETVVEQFIYCLVWRFCCMLTASAFVLITEAFTFWRYGFGFSPFSAVSKPEALKRSILGSVCAVTAVFVFSFAASIYVFKVFKNAPFGLVLAQG
ncbi:hypothetical protein NEDG_01195 [Nematocida displodere]|uniref:Uncharacterized protein n=1 Tax=Nematocida displodere TaxID=1805483 RepID=A0A177EBE8_9MICR|nr:hypothetical protein NEDG_01195 [Nematocida displodere]